MTSMTMKRSEKLAKALDHILTTLITHYQPQKVILFGSMAASDISEWSDIDLVVIKETSLPFVHRLKEVALLCSAPVGVDFLVYTPDEFQKMIVDKNPFILEEIVNKGQILYEQQSARAVA